MSSKIRLLCFFALISLNVSFLFNNSSSIAQEPNEINLSDMSQEELSAHVLSAVRERIGKLDNVKVAGTTTWYDLDSFESIGLSSKSAVIQPPVESIPEESLCLENKYVYCQLGDDYLFSYDQSTQEDSEEMLYRSISSRDGEAGITWMYVDHKDMGKHLRITDREDSLLMFARYQSYLGKGVHPFFCGDYYSFLTMILHYDEKGSAIDMRVEDESVVVTIHFKLSASEHFREIRLDPQKDWMETNVYMAYKDDSQEDYKWWTAVESSKIDGLWMSTNIQRAQHHVTKESGEVNNSLHQFQVELERNSLTEEDVVFEPPEFTLVNDMFEEILYPYGHKDMAVPWDVGSEGLPVLNH